MDNLVIVMAGDGSLHESYASDRDFELWVCYYGTNDAVAERYAASCDRLFRRRGQKWALARQLVQVRDGVGEPPFSRYSYVFLPDDDIAFPGGAADIARAFRLAEEIGADVFQPAIANEFYAFEATRRITDVLCHATNVVEIMMPSFSGALFGRCVLPVIHALRFVRAGWGIEPIITRFGEATLGRPLRTFVLDAVGAIYTRPPSHRSPLHEIGTDEAFLLSLGGAKLMHEIARFADVDEAMRFAFPALDVDDDGGDRARGLAKVRGVRIVHEYLRSHAWSRRILRHIIREARL